MSSKNNKHRETYVQLLMSSLELQNVFQQAGELYKQAQSGGLSEVDQVEYNKLDNSITAAMLGAERKPPKKRHQDVDAT